MYRLAVSDLDGTLLNSQKQISHRSVKAIQNLKKKGILFVAATGRSDVMTKPYFRKIRCHNLVIGCDGAMIRNIETGEVLYEKGLSGEICRRAFEICKNYGLSYYIFAKDELVGDDPENERLKIHQKFNETVEREEQIPIRFVEKLEEYIASHPVYKIVASHEKKEYLDEVGGILNAELDVDAIRSGPRVLAIKAKGVSKAAALKKLTARLGLSLKETVAFGDEVNDIEMLQTAGLGIAMENADAVVKEYADEVTWSNDADGVARKLEELFEI